MRIRLMAGVLAALAVLAGCGAGTTKTQTNKPVSLVLDWYPNAVHALVYAALEQGYFRAQGLEVTLKMPAENPTDGIKLVGAGRETFAFYYQPDVLLARGEGIPVISAAAIVRRPLNGIMVLADSDIQSPGDLVGQDVGYPGIPLNQAMIATMVRTAGGDPAQVRLTDIGWDLVPALATKRMGAISGGFVNHEKLLLEKQGVPVTFFSPTDFGVPNYYELVLITGEQTARQDPATVAAFVKALGQGYEWVKQHPADGLKLLLHKQAKEFPLEPDVEAQSLAMLLPWMEGPDAPFGSQQAADWEKVAAWMVSVDMLKPAVKPADAFVEVAK